MELTDRSHHHRLPHLPACPHSEVALATFVLNTMADEIERLVLSPFRDIVEKANTAADNAEDADGGAAAPMRKAAQNLAKEGERALKKIEPLCKKNYEEYDSNFVDAMKEHGQLSQRSCARS